MKTTPLFRSGRYVSAAIAVFAAVILVNAAPHRHGTDILHFFARTAFLNEGVVTNSSGSVDLNQNKQGNANIQRATIQLRNLDVSTTYDLLVLTGDDTNYTTVSQFSTDSDGKASLNYRKNGSSHGGGLGHGKSLLPAAMDPLSNIRGLAVAVTNGGPLVLTADLTDPDKLQYLIKRDLSTNEIGATLRIKATSSQSQFRLMAVGLAPSADYLLALNGSIVQTNSTDSKGRLAISSLMQDPGAILDVHGVALLDNSTNVVLQTTLP